jgi:hypothetical protein
MSDVSGGVVEQDGGWVAEAQGIYSLFARPFGSLFFEPD